MLGRRGVEAFRSVPLASVKLRSVLRVCGFPLLVSISKYNTSRSQKRHVWPNHFFLDVAGITIRLLVLTTPRGGLKSRRLKWELCRSSLCRLDKWR
ncbi:hypothetical protein TNCV_4350641 [Trichonephila clavipes]|nr:hypothetical protein TNCV_4350641 [Trichonephila clavipes]